MQQLSASSHLFEREYLYLGYDNISPEKMGHSDWFSFPWYFSLARSVIVHTPDTWKILNLICNFISQGHKISVTSQLLVQGVYINLQRANLVITIWWTIFSEYLWIHYYHRLWSSHFFIAGISSTSKTDQALIHKQLSALYSKLRFGNSKSAVSILREIWDSGTPNAMLIWQSFIYRRKWKLALA